MSKPDAQVSDAVDVHRPMHQLSAAAEMVSGVFGVQRKCGDAAALFLGVAEEMGFSGRIQPVHTLMFHRGRSDRSPIFTSSRAVEIAKAVQYLHPDAEPKPGPGFGGDVWAGHVVTIIDSPLSLWDCSFRQFSYAGYTDAPVAIALADDEGPWSVTLEDGSSLAYEVGPGIPGDEEKLRAHIGRDAIGVAVIARFAEAGRSADRNELGRAISQAAAR